MVETLPLMLAGLGAEDSGYGPSSDKPSARASPISSYRLSRETSTAKSASAVGYGINSSSVEAALSPIISTRPTTTSPKSSPSRVIRDLDDF